MSTCQVIAGPTHSVGSLQNKAGKCWFSSLEGEEGDRSPEDLFPAHEPSLLWGTWQQSCSMYPALSQVLGRAKLAWQP